MEAEDQTALQLSPAVRKRTAILSVHKHGEKRGKSALVPEMPDSCE